MENKDKNIIRRNFLELALGITALPSLAFSEGKYFNPKLKGWAIQDPLNKQNVRGFVYIPTVWGQHLKIPDEQSIKAWPYTNFNKRRAPIGLVEAVNKYTDIDAYSDAHLYLSSQHLIQYPFVYITTDKSFELTKTERDNFDYYLRNGGFALLESLEPESDYSQAEASLKQMIKDTLKKDARFSPIPNSHPLYHCFFDFDDGPPQGTEVNWMITSSGSLGTGYSSREFIANVKLSKPIPYLEGIFLDDNLVAVYSGKGYGQKWKDITYNEPQGWKDVSYNEPQQKMGVNFIVYALTKKGGIAKKSKY